MFKPSLKLLLKNVLFECAKYFFTLSDDSRENIWHVAVAKKGGYVTYIFLIHIFEYCGPPYGNLTSEL